MERLNFNIKDRKVLTLGLCLVLVCVFTLTIAYAALNAVLTINGNAEVVGSNWDIHLANPKVTIGSVNTSLPTITSPTTATFSATLNMPGDFYEFTIDAVNSGDIDAVIENVIKSPKLSEEQARYFNYIVEYESGLSITTRQILQKNSFVRFKVRIEYRNDVVETFLPESNTTLNLSLELLYKQFDGTGINVNDNGVNSSEFYRVLSGDLDTAGSEVCVDTECFYVVYSDNNTVTLLSKYNLYVGNYYIDDDNFIPYGEEATGIQHYTMLGTPRSGAYPRLGTTIFGNTSNVYSESVVKQYVDSYSLYLSSIGVNVLEARLITYDEVVELGCVESEQHCYYAPEWLYSTSYWVASSNRLPDGSGPIFTINQAQLFRMKEFDDDNSFGVRPVIILSKNNFN